MEQHRSGNHFSWIVSIVVQLAMLATILPVSRPAAAADTILTLATDYQPTISETIDASGFKHPGVGFTKDVLENMRTQVRAQKEPWNTYFNQMLLAASASRTPAIRNISSTDPSQPRYYGLNSQGVESLFIQDARTAYTQAILYYVTGDETYRANAMQIIRLYEKMDPAQYAYYTDSHIHTGIPLQRMTGAAEILRYTSTQTPALAWTDDDTASFSKNLVTPVVDIFNSCNCRFMNQHLYTTIAAMSGAIFMGNQELYNKTVEWFTVNKDAVDQGQNGAIKRLFRLVTTNDLTGEAVAPAVQHVEMGRDQAHGGGDITDAEILARMMMAQGTKVDPAEGTVSTAPNAVGPYEFLNDRILDAAEQFGTYMTGHEIPWVPTASHTDEFGNPTIVYKTVSTAYRGRSGLNYWELFYYYQYARGVDLSQRAPNFTKFFADRIGYSWDGPDGGGDFWIGIPKAAEAEGSKYLVKLPVDPYREVEDRFTSLEGDCVAMTDDTASFVRAAATAEGSKFGVFGYGYGAPNYGLRVRTNGTASMDLYGTSYAIPDTHGQWRYVILPGNVNDYLPLKFTGNGTTVDVDHINVKASTLLTPPAFKMGAADLNLYSYAGTTLAITLDLSATDPGAGEVLSYQADNLPPGASFDTSTGAFSWKPAQAGTFAFLIEASDGTTVTMKRITIVVDADRQAAVNTADAAYSPNTTYVESTLPAYNAAYADMMSVIGSASDDVFFQKLAALRTATAGLQELNPLLGDGSLNFTNMFLSSDFGTQAGNLLDNSQDTAVGWGPNLTYNMDFGPSFKVAANDFKTLTIAGFPERTGGAAIFGSNDKENWTRLTPGLTARIDQMQDIPVQEELKNLRFRFFKMQMLEPFVPVYQPFAILQMSEFRIFGTRYPTVNKLSSVTLGSEQALKSRIVPGNTVKLSFVSTEAITNVTATIQGQPATVTTTDNLNWTATAVLNSSTAAGPVKFLLNYKTAAGVDAEPTLFTTDGSSLLISDQTDYIGNLLDITTLADSSGRNATDLRKVVNYLFDSDINSGTDFRVNGSGWGAWVSFDFRGGYTATLSKVEILSRQDRYYTRIKGTVVQGSHDNSTWTTISNAAASSADWQTLTISDATPYRYIRIFNGGNWYGNMDELRLYGKVQLDSTAPVTTADAPQGPVNKDTVVTLNATDSGSGVAATYYTVDGGAQQTGTAVSLSTEGIHTIAYWSVDWAGNTEQAHTVTVNIDKTPPVTAASLNPAAPNGSEGWYTTDVSLSLSVVENAGGGAVVTEYQVNGGDWITASGSIAFGDGVYSIAYRSKDEAGNVEQARTVQFSVDKTAPALSVALDQSTVWPPNHKMVTINAKVPASDTGSGIGSVILTSVTSNMPDSGAGDIAADIGTSATSFAVRAEKDHVYTVTYTATDKAGNKTARSATVTVPHDESGVAQQTGAGASTSL
jgi:hypothetical protein